MESKGCDTSCKTDFVLHLLDELVGSGHRTLVFSQSRVMLDILQARGGVCGGACSTFCRHVCVCVCVCVCGEGGDHAGHPAGTCVSVWWGWGSCWTSCRHVCVWWGLDILQVHVGVCMWGWWGALWPLGSYRIVIYSYVMSGLVVRPPDGQIFGPPPPSPLFLCPSPQAAVRPPPLLLCPFPQAGVRTLPPSPPPHRLACAPVAGSFAALMAAWCPQRRGRRL